MRLLFLAVWLSVFTAAWAPAGPSAADTPPQRHGLSVFGDLKYPENFEHFDYSNPDAPKGGRIRLSASGGNQAFDNFNPFILRGNPAESVGLTFDTLMATASDEPDAMYGLIAHSVSMPEDRAYAIFYLRPEARFSDGTAVTAEDVVWTIETLRTRGHPYYGVVLRGVAKITALDPLTVRFDFAPDAERRDLPGLVAGLPVLSQADFKGLDFSEPRNAPLLGSGPYIVQKHRFKSWVTYRRREDYWAKDLPVRKGLYNFDEIRLEYYVDRDIALEAFKAGSFDFIEEFTSANWALKYDFPAVRDGLVKKELLPDDNPSGTQGWWINTRREKFKDPRVRQAIGMAYDFEQANRQLFYGIYGRTDSLFENSDMQAEGPPSAKELALLEPFRDKIPELERATVFGEAYTPPINAGDGDARPNLLKARALLAEAGWTVQDQVLKNQDGEPLEIEFLHLANGGFDKVVWPLIFNLEVLGVQARLRKIDPAAMAERVKSFDFDMTVRRYRMDSTPGVGLRNYLHSSTAQRKGSQNLPGVNSEVVDALLEKIQGAENREDLVVAAKALDRVFRAGHYWVSNWYKGSHSVAYWDRFGKPQDLGVPKPRFERGVLSTWWFDEEKSAAVDAARGR